MYFMRRSIFFSEKWEGGPRIFELAGERGYEELFWYLKFKFFKWGGGGVQTRYPTPPKTYLHVIISVEYFKLSLLPDGEP